MSTLHLRIESNSPLEFPLGCYMKNRATATPSITIALLPSDTPSLLNTNCSSTAWRRSWKLYKLKDVSGGKPTGRSSFLLPSLLTS